MAQLYSTQAAYDTYVYYLALKRHFTSSYDFFKYQGKVKANVQSFEKRKDKFFFYKLSKNPECKQIILANILKDPNIWIGKILDDKSIEVHTAWLKRQNSLTYVFKSDLKKLNPDFDENILCEDGQHPPLLELYLQEEISLETLVIINVLTKCFSYWSKKIQDKIVFPSINSLVDNYTPFINIDKEKMKKLVIHEFT